MENKENVTNSEVKTKIPLPKKPLPPMPSKLIRSTVSENLKQCKHNQRHPLKTLQSQGNTSKLNLDFNKLIGKHVTFRHSDSPLDWEYKVFQDDFELLEIKKKPVKEVSVCQKDVNGVVECDILKLNETNRPKTPIGSNLEHPRIRNIKRSLKRPHSRELQGLTPIRNRIQVNAENKIKPQPGGRIIDRLEKLDHSKYLFNL